MHQVTIHEAKTHLSRLIREALAGEEVIVARGKKPLVRIAPLAEAAGPKRRIGGAKGVIRSMDAHFCDELDDFSDYLP